MAGNSYFVGHPDGTFTVHENVGKIILREGTISFHEATDQPFGVEKHIITYGVMGWTEYHKREN